MRTGASLNDFESEFKALRNYREASSISMKLESYMNANSLARLKGSSSDHTRVVVYSWAPTGIVPDIALHDTNTLDDEFKALPPSICSIAVLVHLR